MDTSPEYIKMCEKGWPDIGEYLINDEGVIDSLYYCTKHNQLIERDEDCCPICYGRKGNESPCDYDKDRKSWWIILPHQDQLQEMLKFTVGTFKDNFWSALGDLHNYAFTVNVFNESIPTSMEQLWLAFVYQEKYNKVWNGEEWILR